MNCGREVGDCPPNSNGGCRAHFGPGSPHQGLIPRLNSRQGQVSQVDTWDSVRRHVKGQRAAEHGGAQT